MSKRLRQQITLKSTNSRPDLILLILTILLTVFGVIIVGDASVVEAFRDFGDKFYYLKLQAQWLGIGLLGFLGGIIFDFRKLRIFSFPLLVTAILSLLILLIPGVGISAFGARRWLGIGNIRFQPSELAKFALVLWSAAFLSNKKNPLVFMGVLALLILLVIIQPDLGTATILGLIGLVVYFLSGASILKIGLISLFGLLMGIILIFTSPYRKERLLTFLNPTRDPFGASYHIRQVLIALGSGGLWGLGLGQSRQKYEYIPAVTTDSIFAIIGEEMGFIGTCVVIILFLVLIWRGFKIAKESPEEFGRLLAGGITTWIGLQFFLNIGAMTALIPFTGVPLPFISYGGSSLVLTLTAMGILINISRYKIVRK